MLLLDFQRSQRIFSTSVGAYENNVTAEKGEETTQKSSLIGQEKVDKGVRTNEISFEPGFGA